MTHKNETPLGFASLDAQMRFQYIDEILRELLGDSGEEILGRTLAQVMPNLATTHREALDQVFETERALVDLPITEPGELAECSAHCQHKPSERTWLATLTPFHGKDGAIQGFSMQVRDATAEHRARTFFEGRTHAQKLESLGVLAGGIAHDFNNILTSILANAGLAQSRLPEGSTVRRPLVEIEMAAQHAAELADQMLAYSGRGQFAIAPLDLHQLVQQIVHLLRLSITKKAHLEFQLTENLPLVKGDSSQLRQVVMNLITNASDALGDRGGKILLRTRLVDVDRVFLDDLYLKENLAPGPYVCLEVSDTGCGMDEETQARLFDPFFTTKTSGRGLGMAAVLGILRGHRGSVRVVSAPEQGTTFTVLLPASSERKHQEELPSAEEGPTKKKGTVLVVDDEELIRTVARNILEDFGHEVLEAADGKEAVDVFHGNPSTIDAVVLDMTMPNIDGPETLRLLRHMEPEVRVLLSSGYSEQEARLLMADYQGVSFLKKPYLPRELIGKLQEFLEGPGPP